MGFRVYRVRFLCLGFSFFLASGFRASSIFRVSTLSEAGKAPQSSVPRDDLLGTCSCKTLNPRTLKP